MKNTSIIQLILRDYMLYRGIKDMGIFHPGPNFDAC